MKPLLLSLTFLLSSCALLSKGELGTRRFFSPELVAPAVSTAPLTHLELRLGRVSAAACGSEAMMYRRSQFEVGFDHERRWTEKPEVYLRRALSQVLFEGSGVQSVMRGAAPVLEVELLEFEEVRAPSHVGRVKVAWSLGDERVVWAQQTVRFERPIASSSGDAEGEAIVSALSGALHEAVEAIGQQVSAELSRRSTPAGS
ncbi:MAG: ABC-type transport auxiliary lipoprotein family protein [Archangium sp.]|nr:ABC-type transport auxiliary lipoprotein family protein [Archangium sp.]MDP3575963.1 ABC-type transport auxiliary lipoprotein family protein [Archangium sp.]